MLYLILNCGDYQRYAYRLPEDIKDTVREEVYSIDRVYGSRRSIDSDGGYILIAENKEDIREIYQSHFKLSRPYEWIEHMGDYIRVMYLFNNDYAVSVYMPCNIAPDFIVNEE